MPKYKVFVTKTQEHELEVDADSPVHAEQQALASTWGRMPDEVRTQTEVMEVTSSRRQAGLTAA